MKFDFKSCNIDILTRQEQGAYVGQALIYPRPDAHSQWPQRVQAHATGELQRFESEIDAIMFAQHRAIVWVNQNAC